MITVDEDCGISYAILVMQNVTFIIGYGVVTAFYILIGLTGNITLLISFYKQSKKDSAYAYQVFLTTSKALEIFFFSWFILGYKWGSGTEHEGLPWYLRNYWLKFYAAHIGCPLGNTFIVSSLLCAVAMTADRVFALGKPFVYKNIDHSKHQIVAVTVCFVIGILTNVYETMRWYVQPKVVNGTWDGYYEVLPDEDYLASPLGVALANIRTGVRFVGVFALIGLNIAMGVIFRKRMEKVGKMTAATTNDEKEKERRASEKTLLILTIYQSCLMAANQIPHCGEYIAIFASATFTRCWGVIVAPFVDGCIQVTDTIDLFVIIAINQKMRRAVLSVLPSWMQCRRAMDQTSVKPLVPATTSRSLC